MTSPTRPRALLLSTYELGRQPFALASPAAWLRRAGWDVDCVDLTRDKLRDSIVSGADFVGIHLAMHAATRMAGPVIARARTLNATARICAYGLYAPLNETWLRSLGVTDVLGGEFEEDLVRIAGSADLADLQVRTALPHLQFIVPDRFDLPALTRYAGLLMPDGTRRTVGSTEASRGCKHLCRHCPVVPVYQGQFRVVQPEVVLADVDAQVAAGAEHITFGDPDFLNGPTHAMRIVEAMHAAHPAVTYDATIKIEHLLNHRGLLPTLAATGCAFVTSAVESVDDRVLARLEKGHTRADFVDAVALCRAAGLTLSPTFVAFHPWLSLEDYCTLLDTVEGLDLVEHVAPIQLAIRLLIPNGSRLLELQEMQDHLAGFDPVTLTYRWVHPDPRVEELQRNVMSLVGTRMNADRRDVFDEISKLAHARASVPRPAFAGADAGMVPHLSEPWYCCAEPNAEEMTLV